MHVGAANGRRENFERVFWLCFALQLLQCALSVYTCAWMADESAWHFFGLLQDQNVAVRPGRDAALALLRAPVWLLKDGLGIHDFRVLAIAYGLTLNIVWPLALLLCLRMARAHDLHLLVLPVLSYALGSASVLFTASEAHVTHAAFWVLALAILLYRRTVGRILFIYLLLVFFALTHGSTVVLGPLLVGLCLWKLRQLAWRDLWLWGAALLALLTAVYGLHLYLTAGQGAVSLVPGLRNGLLSSQKNVDLILCLAVLGLLPVLALVLGRTGRLVVAAIMVALSLAMGSYHFIFPGELHPDLVGYGARGLTIIVPCLLFGALALYVFRGGFRANLQALASSLCLVWLGQVGFGCAMAYQFHRYIGFLRDHAADKRGIIPVVTGSLSAKRVGLLRFDRNGDCPLGQKLVGRVPVYPYASMWIAVPAHALLYSGGRITSILMPTTGTGEALNTYLAGYLTPQGQARLVRAGFELDLDRELCRDCCTSSALPSGLRQQMEAAFSSRAGLTR